jgi:hypothetical protein
MVVPLVSTSEKPIFEYFGLEIYIDVNDLHPLAFYGRSANNVSKIIVHLDNGMFSHLEIISIDGIPHLEEGDRENFLKIIDYNLTEIIKFWIDLFVYKKSIPFKKILKPLF